MWRRVFPAADFSAVVPQHVHTNFHGSRFPIDDEGFRRWLCPSTCPETGGAVNDASPFRDTRISDDLVEIFTGLVCEGQDADAARMISQLMAGGLETEALMLELLAPSARLMGEFWCDDRRDFVEVTLGLARLQQLVRQFRLPGGAGGGRGDALLAPVPGEQHTFGVRLVEELLLRAGWRITATLASTEAEIARLVAAEHYDFVGFSVTSERLLPGLRSAIHSVRSNSRNRNVRIIVGGVLFALQNLDPADFAADAIVRDAQEAVAIANAWFGLVDVE